jgi:hypothetical protein
MQCKSLIRLLRTNITPKQRATPRCRRYARGVVALLRVITESLDYLRAARPHPDRV